MINIFNSPNKISYDLCFIHNIMYIIGYNLYIYIYIYIYMYIYMYMYMDDMNICTYNTRT